MLTARRIGFMSVLLTALFLQSCGFYLRGSGHGDIPAVMLSGQPSSLMARLDTELRLRGIDVTHDEQRAVWRVSIQEHPRVRRVMSIDINGKAQEYELHQSVTLSVTDMKNNRRLAQQNIQHSRDLLFDKTEVLGKNYEESLLYEDIENDIVNAVVWNLRTLSERASFSFSDSLPHASP